jgi:hypothetical protein
LWGVFLLFAVVSGVMSIGIIMEVGGIGFRVLVRVLYRNAISSGNRLYLLCSLFFGLVICMVICMIICMIICMAICIVVVIGRTIGCIIGCDFGSMIGDDTIHLIYHRE